MSLVFLFPGQGSQSQGMLNDWVDSPIVKDSIQEASDVLGYDMAQLIAENPDGQLDQTRFTQPALLASSVAMLRVWQQSGGAVPAQVAGHSLGEYSALVAANVIGYADAVSLVAFRGQAMTEAVADGVGKMAAIIGLDDAQVEVVCNEASDETSKVWPANYNCPGQLVIAGHAAAVERAMEKAKQAGAKRALSLAVSAPSHTPLMQDAADAMKDKLSSIMMNDPSIPVWSNARASLLTSSADIRTALVEQLVQPVRWTQCVQAMVANGADNAVEMGPGKVLSGLVRRIDRQVAVFNPLNPDAMDAAVNGNKG